MLHWAGAGKWRGGRGYNGQLLCHDGVQRPCTDCSGTFAQTPYALPVWRFPRDHALCGLLHNDLPVRQHFRHDGPWHEQLYQLPGLREDRDADRSFRRCGQYCPGPFIHLCLPPGRPGSGLGHHHLPGAFRRLDPMVPHQRQGHSKAEKNGLPLKNQTRYGHRGPWPVRLYHGHNQQPGADHV